MARLRRRLLAPLVAVALTATASPALALGTPSATDPSATRGTAAVETATKAKKGTVKVVLRTPQGVPATVVLRGRTTRTAAKPVPGTRVVRTFKVAPGRLRIEAPTVVRAGRVYTATRSAAKVRVGSGRTVKVTVRYRLAATARNLTLDDLGDTRVGLTWQGVGGSGVRLVRTTGTAAATSPTQGQPVPVSGTTALDTTVQPSTGYTYSLFTRVKKAWVGPISVSLGTLPAPGGDEEAPGSSWIASPDTQILTQGQISWARYLPAGALFRFRGTLPAVGTVVGSPVTPGLPQGFLGRITSYRPDGVAVAAPVTLGEAFDYLDIQAPVGGGPVDELPPSDPPPLLAPAKPERTRPSSGTQQAAPRVECQRGTSATVQFDPTFDLDGDFDGTVLKKELPYLPDVPRGAHLEGSARVKIAGALSAESKGSFTCGLALPKFSKQLTVVPVPLNLTFEPAAEVTASAGLKVYNVGASAEAGFWYEAQFGIGVDNYARGDIFKDVHVLQPHVSGQAGINVVVSGELIVGPGGGSAPVGAVAGVRGTLEVLNANATGFEVLKEGNPEPDRCIKLDVGGKLGVDLVAKAWVPGWEDEANLDIPELTTEWSYLGKPYWYPRNCVDPALDEVYLLDIESEGHDGESLETALLGLGYNVERGSAMPQHPERFGQIWAIATYDGYPADVLEDLSEYVHTGGSVFINSEHECCQKTNDDVTEFLRSVVLADVTAVTDCPNCESAANPLNPAARDDVANVPNAGATVHTDALGYYTGVPAANQLLVVSDYVGATVWGEEDMRLGRGRVVTIADSNWSDSHNVPTNAAFLENVAHYLSQQ